MTRVDRAGRQVKGLANHQHQGVPMLHVFEQNGTMHWTARTQKAGKANVPASTFWFEFDAPNDVLNQFDPDLKPSLYRKPHPSEMDVADKADTRNDDPNYLPKLRHPGIVNEYLDMKGSLTGATLTLHIGTRGKSDIEMTGDVDNYKVGPREGGTVRVKLRVNARPDKVQWFYENNDQDVCFSITPAKEAQGDLLAQKPSAIDGTVQADGERKPTRVATLEEWPFPKSAESGTDTNETPDDEGNPFAAGDNNDDQDD
jgi:hypothetical protein